VLRHSFGYHNPIFRSRTSGACLLAFPEGFTEDFTSQKHSFPCLGNPWVEFCPSDYMPGGLLGPLYIPGGALPPNSGLLRPLQLEHNKQDPAGADAGDFSQLELI
jgi:hypothetical protein